MPKRKGGGKGKGGKKKKKKKGAKDWSYYDDFGQDNSTPKINTLGGPRNYAVDVLRDDTKFTQASHQSSSSSEFDDSDSDVDTAYDTLVASTTAIAAATSSVYSKLLKQQSLEEDGKSDDSEDSVDDDDDSEHDDVTQQVYLEEEEEEDVVVVVDDDDDENDDDDDDEEEEEEEEEEEVVMQVQEQVKHGKKKSTKNSAHRHDNAAIDPVLQVQGDDHFVKRFLNPSCNEDTIRQETELRASSSFAAIDTPPGSTLNVRYQSVNAFPTSKHHDLTTGFRLKPRVATKWLSLEKKGSTRDRNGFTPLQALLYSSINQYDDLIYMDRTVLVPKTKREESCMGGSGWELREMLSLHMVNHITKARDAVSLHTQEIRRKREERKLEMNANQVKKILAMEKKGNRQDPRKKKKSHTAQTKEHSNDPNNGQTPLTSLIGVDGDDTPSYQIVQDKHRDQGLSRTRVLVVLPTRSSAERYVKSILRCLPKTVKTIHNKRRFEVEYGLPEMADEEEYEDQDDILAREREILQSRERTRDGRRRSEDWIELFARNDNDCFTLGMSFSRKEVKLYSDFASSDLIVASPLGLRMAMGAEGEDEKGKRLDADFLSSIEVLVVDQMEALEMQNWEHLQQIMSYMNQTPKNEAAQTIDFSRVRELDLLNMGKHYRQTVFVSSHKMPELTAMAKRCCFNQGSVVKVRRSKYAGSIAAVVPKVRQLYRRVDCTSLSSSDDERFDFFVKHLFPKLQRICRGLDAEEETLFNREKEQGTILFVPSYFDFLRIKNLFHEEGLRPALCSEYTEPKQQTRNRSLFFHGDQRILIYTERNHFYHRFRIRGARHVIFYAPPQHASVYPDMLNVLSTKTTGVNDGLCASSSSSSASVSDPSVTVLFTKYDALRLERIAGTERTKRMVKGKGGKTTYLFL